MGETAEAKQLCPMSVGTGVQDGAREYAVESVNSGGCVPVVGFILAVHGEAFASIFRNRFSGDGTWPPSIGYRSTSWREVGELMYHPCHILPMTTTNQNETLLVPVANPETAERLLDTAIDIARDRSMQLVVLHVVEVPPQVPLSEGDSLLGENGQEEQLLKDAVEQAEDARVAVDSRMRYARDVATGIIGAVDVHDADALLVGWRGRPRRRDIILGSFLDRILGKAPCDVFVKRIRTPSRDIDSILVPVAGGPHCELAVGVAGTIASQRDAAVHLLHVHHPDVDDSTKTDISALIQDYGSSLTDMDIRIESTTLRSAHVAGAITDETANHDLTILGATRDPFLKRKLVGSVAEGVGRAAASSVILTRRDPSLKDS